MVMLEGSSHNINNVLNRNKNKPNDPVATVPKDDIILYLIQVYIVTK